MQNQINYDKISNHFMHIVPKKLVMIHYGKLSYKIWTIIPCICTFATHFFGEFLVDFDPIATRMTRSTFFEALRADRLEGWTRSRDTTMRDVLKIDDGAANRSRPKRFLEKRT